MDTNILEEDLKSNLGLEKFNELPITTDEIRSTIDRDREKSITTISYLNFVSQNLFDSPYDELKDKKRNLILLVSTPMLNAIMKGKVSLEDVNLA